MSKQAMAANDYEARSLYDTAGKVKEARKTVERLYKLGILDYSSYQMARGIMSNAAYRVHDRLEEVVGKEDMRVLLEQGAV